MNGRANFEPAATIGQTFADEHPEAEAVSPHPAAAVQQRIRRAEVLRDENDHQPMP